MPVPLGVQDRRDLLELWVQRGRRDESPAPLTLRCQRALQDPQDPLALPVRMEMLASKEKGAGRDPKVGRGTSGLRDQEALRGPKVYKETQESQAGWGRVE